MALTVEDGTGIAGANSYVSLATALIYHTDRNNVAWLLASDTQRTAALIAATFYVDRMYLHRWPGVKTTASQSLQWPRSWAADINGYSIYGICQELKDAVCEAALIALSADLNPVLSAPVKRKSIGNGAIDTTYVTSDTVPVRYTLVERLLGTIVASGNDLARG